MSMLIYKICTSCTRGFTHMRTNTHIATVCYIWFIYYFIFYYFGILKFLAKQNICSFDYKWLARKCCVLRCQINFKGGNKMHLHAVSKLTLRSWQSCQKSTIYEYFINETKWYSRIKKCIFYCLLCTRNEENIIV